MLDAGDTDTLQFGEGILRGEVSFTRSGRSLVVAIAGGDQLTIERQFDPMYTNNRVETFRLADGSSFSWLEVQNLLGQGAPGDHLV